jgi:lycopene cyclase domain-containing protein
MYAISCLPFVVVNGLLTGSWIEGEIVWYNNAHNLGIRLGTIPIEDLVYSMMMLLSNVFWFEIFKGKYINAN